MEFDGYWVSPRGGVFELKDSEFSKYKKNNFKSDLITTYHFSFVLKYPKAFAMSEDEVNELIDKHNIKVEANTAIYDSKISRKKRKDLEDKYKNVDMDYQIDDDVITKVCKKGWIKVRNNSTSGYIATAYTWYEKTLDSLNSFVQFALDKDIIKKSSIILVYDIKTGISGRVPVKVILSYTSVDDFFNRLNESMKTIRLKDLLLL